MRLEAEDFTPELVAELVPKLAPLIREHIGQGGVDPWLDADAAAEYLSTTRKRVLNLRSQRRLPADGYDGRYPLWRRSTLDRYVQNGGTK